MPWEAWRVVKIICLIKKLNCYYSEKKASITLQVLMPNSNLLHFSDFFFFFTVRLHVLSTLSESCVYTCHIAISKNIALA